MKILVEAYGCTLNHGEAEEFIEKVLEQGHEIVSSESQAKVYALFTCGVIKTTENHMLKRIGQLAKASSKELLVCGCLGNINPEAIMKIAPHAQLFGPSEQILASKVFTGSKQPGVRSFDPQPKVGILPIATGCMGNCSYCITKKARGPLQSRPIEDIKQRLEMLVARGCVEIQVCAQDTAVYGADIGSNLGKLIDELETVHGNFMIRIGMMNPANVKKHLDDILQAYESEKVFKFLHLPVQSGSDSVLEAMNRGYKTQDFDDIVEAFRDRFPEMALSTDIIVGFPNETDKDFQASLNLIKRSKPDLINITRFSSRPDTEAHEMANSVFPGIARNRSKELTTLRFKITGENYRRILGQKVKGLASECLIEGTTIMRTENYKPIVVSDKLELGKWYEIEITGVERVYLKGKLIAKA
ncbi:MAG: tRNA (N(6)-L-threonylcarbamoyladenosine(37)-C(2))-methylthiotransferase [Thermoplasmata archaeon]|nr:tRNA (N(6)-L-threonylcarbamoyladenosine(37)-C(2))-methylthiotransferase [Thermoplasmata archaeon]